MSQLVLHLNNVSVPKSINSVHFKRDLGIVGPGSVVICKKRILQKSINCIIWSWINSFYSETKLLYNVWATASVSSLNFNSFMVANPSLPQNREVSRITGQLWWGELQQLLINYKRRIKLCTSLSPNYCT